MGLLDRRGARGASLAALAALVLAVSWARDPSAAADRSRGGESQIDESAPDAAAPDAGAPGGTGSLEERLRDYVEGSFARYDALKTEAAVFRRQGSFPSFFLRDPGRDVTLETGPDGKRVVTVHVSYARRDLEQRLMTGPAERFELPGADQRFLAALVAELATFSPEIGRARLRFWFGGLRLDGRVTWELRGGLGIAAAAASRFPRGSRTAEAVWPALDENTLPASLWEPR